MALPDVLEPESVRTDPKALAQPADRSPPVDPTHFGRAEVLHRVFTLLRAKKWWILAILAVFAFDLTVAPFFDYWPRHAIVSAVVSSALVLLLTVWLIDDLEQHRTRLRWGPLSSLASQKIVEAAVLTERRITARTLELHGAVLARDPDAWRHEELTKPTPQQELLSSPIHGFRLLNYLAEGDPTRDLDDVISQWGTLATMVPDNAAWLSQAAVLRGHVASAVQLKAEAELLTRLVAERCGTIGHAPDGRTVFAFPNGWDPEGLVEWRGIGDEFGRRWELVAQAAAALTDKDNELRDATVAREIREGLRRPHARPNHEIESNSTQTAS